MISDIDILTATKEKLKSIYPNYPVYLEETKEGFDSPCFFLKLQITQTQQNKANFFTDCNLYISYFSLKNDSAANLYKVKNKVRQLFLFGLQVENRYLHFTSISATTSGQDADICEFTLPFNFYDSIDVQETNYKMNELGIEIKNRKV